MKQLYESLGISKEVYEYGEGILEALKERFAAIDETAEYNQLKVIAAMQKAHVSAECFNASSGYGYDDIGRDTLEEVYAAAFHTEAALVRPQITCGTHALAIALAGNLRPGDELLSISGRPYDTLRGSRWHPVVLRKSCRIPRPLTYARIDLLEDGSFTAYEGIEKALRPQTPSG
ncbi:MAG: methionine gamma-lyase family protein [Lachnospiraceae bacterium]